MSFCGIVTYKTAQPIRDAVPLVPRDRLLVETDCPYLAPEPGQQSEPAHVAGTAQYAAELWGVALADVVQQIEENFFRLFRVPA